MAATPMTTINSAGAPNPAARASSRRDGGGAVRRAMPVGNSGDANHDAANAMTAPANADGTRDAATKRARVVERRPMACSAGKADAVDATERVMTWASTTSAAHQAASATKP